MKTIHLSFLSPLALLLFVACLFAPACKQEENVSVVPTINISDATAFEGNGTMKFQFRVSLSTKTDVAVSVDYTTTAGTAMAGLDFVATSGTLTFAAGETSKFIDVSIVCDTLLESDDQFTLVLTNAVKGVLSKAIGTGTIRNDDTYSVIPDEGYITPETYPDMTLIWGDEFSGTSIDGTKWDYNIGGSGWGNNELQYYTNSSENSRLQDGHLIIEAKAQNVGGRNYTSARLLSKGKKDFMYGRVDIRAKLPKGQGIWPALWMLGANIDEVTWPLCGEIDIMELRGQDPKTVHGTVHFLNNDNVHAFVGSSSYLSGTKTFADQFHVFSLIWKQDEVNILVDDKQYYTATKSGLAITQWPFNAPFFMIMNIAVGGNFLGNPDATTVFPQQMIVDYVRVFQ